MPCITLRRELMSLFRAVWPDMSSFPSHGVSPSSQQELLVALRALPFCNIDFRLPPPALVTASDASESGCVVCRCGPYGLGGVWPPSCIPHIASWFGVDLFGTVGYADLSNCWAFL